MLFAFGSLVRDLRFAARSIMRHPGLTAAITVSIALGIAANATVFSLVNAVLFSALPVEQPDRLVALGRGSMSYPDYVDYRDQVDAFEGVSARFPVAPASLGGGEPERIWGQLVTANYFDVLGLAPALGRGFLPDENLDNNGATVVVLSDGLWRRRFGGDPATLGQAVVLSNRSFTVVGIMPTGFYGEDRGLVAEFWAPLSMSNHFLPEITSKDPIPNRSVNWLSLTGRLGPGVTRQHAQAAVNVVKDRIDAEHDPKNVGKDPLPLNKAGGLMGGADRAVSGLLAVLMVIVGLVLLIACANVANIMLARASGRQKEISIRLAVGADRRRLIRQLLTESVLLASLGACAGVIPAYLATEAMSSARLPIPLPFRLDFTPDGTVLVFTAVLTVFTGLLFGVVPAFRGTRPDLVSTLKEEGGNIGSFRCFGLRQILVVTQVALSIVLLVSAGLFLRSLQNASSINLGLRADNLLLMSFDPKLHSYSVDQKHALFRNLRERVRALPGIQSTSLVDIVPLSIGSHSSGFETTGAGGEIRTVKADIISVSGDYFETVGTRLVRGRAIDPSIDRNNLVAIVNQATAEHLFPGEDPIGRTVREGGRSLEVIGLAENSKSRTLAEELQPCVYQSLEQNDENAVSLFGTTFMARTTDDPDAQVHAVREQFRALDPNLAVFGIETMQDHVDKALLVPKLSALLLGVFGVVGLVLASVGLYGVMSYSISRRRKEIGIRMALGAPTAGILRTVIRQGMVVACVGLVFGLVAAAAVGRLYSSFLYGISPHDIPTFVTVPILLLAIAFLSTLIPALRASKVQPSTAIRYE